MLNITPVGRDSHLDTVENRPDVGAGFVPAQHP